MSVITIMIFTWMSDVFFFADYTDFFLHSKKLTWAMLRSLTVPLQTGDSAEKLVSHLGLEPRHIVEINESHPLDTWKGRYRALERWFHSPHAFSATVSTVCNALDECELSEPKKKWLEHMSKCFAQTCIEF